MARNRVIYQTEALYVAATGGGDTATQIKRVQSANYSFDISRQDVNQYGQLARIDSIILDPPTVSLDFNYYVTDGVNEESLGFTVTEPAGSPVNFLSGLIADQTNPQEKNYYIATLPAGNDAVGASALSGQRNFIGIGNGVIASYSVDASVGDLPTVSLTVEASNIGVKSGTAPLVAVNKTNGVVAQSSASTIPTAASGAGASALRPGDVGVKISGGVGVNISPNNFKATSASVSFDLSREDISKLGSKFAFAKEIDFPVTCTFTCEGILADLDQAGGLGSVSGLNQTVADDSTTYNLELALSGNGTHSGIRYQIKGAKLDSQSFSSSVGDNKTVSFTFSTQLGGPQDIANGLFVSRIAPV